MSKDDRSIDQPDPLRLDEKPWLAWFENTAAPDDPHCIKIFAQDAASAAIEAHRVLGKMLDRCAAPPPQFLGLLLIDPRIRAVLAAAAGEWRATERRAS